MSFMTIVAAVAVALGALSGPVVLVGGPTGPAPDAAARLSPAGRDDDGDDGGARACVGVSHPPKSCYEGLYLPPAVGGDQPGRLSPDPGYVSGPPGELVAPLGGGYVATSPGQAIPPVGGGYVSSPPGVAISPVG